MEELNYRRLFVPYTRDGHTLENMLSFLIKKATELRIPDELILRSVHEIFVELSKGKEYPRDYCPCGCGIDKAGTAITHEILNRMIRYNIDDKSAFILEQLRLRSMPPPEEIVEEEPVEEIKTLTLWDKSPVLRIIRRACRWIGSR